jgi:hypothetical protein
MWDAFQREVLGAMGHTLLVPAARQALETAAPAQPALPPNRQPQPQPQPQPHAPAADAGARPALLHALARAAGTDGDIRQYMALPPLADLRTPLAKRRLWPSLRAMRKAPPA